MSGGRSKNFSESESNTCVVCFRIVDAFSVGVCDHPVCFECSTRMRVLCGQLECPICRQDMPIVIFTKEIEPFVVLQSKLMKDKIEEVKYGIRFVTSSLHRRFQRLLEHECFICRRNANNLPFKTFAQLKEHMRRSHELFYCELCVVNLNIFTFERKCYTRAELATHRRKGDADNTSHRGHPLCEFCNTRFMDNDELFRHLRRDHLFCHFCDADGKHQYYNTYDDLRRHYLDEHYLCEEGECKYERFTSVFRTDIDLKAHYASVHSKNLSKAANRQARTLELEFTLAPRIPPSRQGRNGAIRNQDAESASGSVSYSFEPGGLNSVDDTQIFSNPLAAENFPSLGGENGGPLRAVSNVVITSKVNPLSQENFPSLKGGARKAAVTITSTTGSSQVRNLPNFRDVSAAGNENHKVSIRLSHNNSFRPKSSNKDFPALKKNADNFSDLTQPQWGVGHKAQPQWLTQRSKKREKVAPAPDLPPSSLNEYPSLGKGDSKQVSSSSVWVNLNSFNNNSTPKKNKVSSKTIELTNKKKPASNATTTKVEKQLNGLQIKRSELNVEVTEPDSVTITGSNSSFKPPPGFKMKPPPGLNVFPLNNDLIFTNSSGHSYQIQPSFFHPADFKMRNARLIKRLENVPLDTDKMQTFKTYSNLYKTGEIQADKYYEHCQASMGSEFDQIFPELLVLLPNVQRQQELYAIHKSNNDTKELNVCATCHQIIFNAELRDHLSNHVLDNHFPILNRTTEDNNVWNKK